MLKKSNYIDWSEKNDVMGNFESMLFAAYEATNSNINKQKILLAFPHLFECPQLEITLSNCRQVFDWITASKLETFELFKFSNHLRDYSNAQLDHQLNTFNLRNMFDTGLRLTIRYSPMGDYLILESFFKG